MSCLDSPSLLPPPSAKGPKSRGYGETHLDTFRSIHVLAGHNEAQTLTKTDGKMTSSRHHDGCPRAGDKEDRTNCDLQHVDLVEGRVSPLRRSDTFHNVLMDTTTFTSMEGENANYNQKITNSVSENNPQKASQKNKRVTYSKSVLKDEAYKEWQNNKGQNKPGSRKCKRSEAAPEYVDDLDMDPRGTIKVEAHLGKKRTICAPRLQDPKSKEKPKDIPKNIKIYITKDISKDRSKDLPKDRTKAHTREDKDRPHPDLAHNGRIDYMASGKVFMPPACLKTTLAFRNKTVLHADSSDGDRSDKMKDIVKSPRKTNRKTSDSYPLEIQSVDYAPRNLLSPTQLKMNDLDYIKRNIEVLSLKTRERIENMKKGHGHPDISGSIGHDENRHGELRMDNKQERSGDLEGVTVGRVQQQYRLRSLSPNRNAHRRNVKFAKNLARSCDVVSVISCDLINKSIVSSNLSENSSIPMKHHNMTTQKHETADVVIGPEKRYNDVRNGLATYGDAQSHTRRHIDTRHDITTDTDVSSPKQRNNGLKNDCISYGDTHNSTKHDNNNTYAIETDAVISRHTQHHTGNRHMTFIDTSSPQHKYIGIKHGETPDANAEGTIQYHHNNKHTEAINVHSPGLVKRQSCNRFGSLTVDDSPSRYTQQQQQQDETTGYKTNINNDASPFRQPGGGRHMISKQVDDSPSRAHRRSGQGNATGANVIRSHIMEDKDSVELRSIKAQVGQLSNFQQWLNDQISFLKTEVESLVGVIEEETHLQKHAHIEGHAITSSYHISPKKDIVLDALNVSSIHSVTSRVTLSRGTAFTDEKRFVRRRRDLIIQSHVQNTPKMKEDSEARDMTARIQITCLVVLVCINVLMYLGGAW